jgi:hypothetical protein
MRKHWTAAVAAGLLLSLLAFSLPVRADQEASSRLRNALVILNKLRTGELYFGGKPPRIERIVPVKEEQDPATGKYRYKLKVVVERASGDHNGFFNIYIADTWGQAIKRLLKVDGSVEAEWIGRFLLIPWQKTFPPLRSKYEYALSTRQGGWLFEENAGYGTRRRVTARQFVENLYRGFEPGTYEVQLWSRVSLDDHPIVSVYDIWEWFDFAQKVRKKELLDSMSLSWDAFKAMMKSAFTETSAVYTMQVNAKVPKLIGLDYRTATQELLNRNLGISIQWLNGCAGGRAGKVAKQGFPIGKHVKAGTAVAVKACRLAEIPGEVVDRYNYVFLITSCNKLYVGTPESLRPRVKGSFTGCGNDWSTKVQFRPLSNGYKSLADAQKALCGLIKGKGWWNGGACSEVYCFTSGPCSIQNPSQAYWGCEPSLPPAVDTYCPQYSF